MAQPLERLAKTLLASAGCIFGNPALLVQPLVAARLSGVEQLAVGTVLEVAQGARSLAAFEQLMLPLLQRHIACDQLFFAVGDGICGHALGFDENVRRSTAARFPRYERELVPFASAAARSGGVGVDREFFGETALRRMAYYHEIMRPHSGRSSLIGYLSFHGDLQAAIIFGRSSPRFLAREQQALREVLPALSLARAAFQPRPAAGCYAKERSRLSERLSEREREVLSYLVLGYTNAEIALACGTSFRTVRNQLTSVFRKLGASTRAEAVALALRQ